MFSLIKAPVNVLWSTCYMEKKHLYMCYSVMISTVHDEATEVLALKKSIKTWRFLKCFLFLHCVRVLIVSQCSALAAQWIEPVSNTLVEKSAHFNSGRLLYIDLSETQVFINPIQTAFCWPVWNSILQSTKNAQQNKCLTATSLPDVTL